MNVVVITNDDCKKELTSVCDPSDVYYTASIDEAIQMQEADVLIDLLFVKDDNRIKKLSSCLPKLIIVNCVEHTLLEIHPSFIRINGWPTLLKSTLLEAAGKEIQHSAVENIFSLFGKTIEWTKDQPGFISARIITCIIREAIYAYRESVSSKEDIDKAMKLGTSYPFGPFEWYEKIGPDRVNPLLDKISK